MDFSPSKASTSIFSSAGLADQIDIGLGLLDDDRIGLRVVVDLDEQAVDALTLAKREHFVALGGIEYVLFVPDPHAFDG